MALILLPIVSSLVISAYMKDIVYTDDGYCDVCEAPVDYIVTHTVTDINGQTIEWTVHEFCTVHAIIYAMTTWDLENIENTSLSDLLYVRFALFGIYFICVGIYYLYNPKIEEPRPQPLPQTKLPPPPPPPSSTPKCQKCGAALTFIPNYGRWYCNTCGEYMRGRKRSGHKGRVAVVLIIIPILLSVTISYYMATFLYIDDGYCDVCSKRAHYYITHVTYNALVTYIRYEYPVHEYCTVHAIMYTMTTWNLGDIERNTSLRDLLWIRFFLFGFYLLCVGIYYSHSSKIE